MELEALLNLSKKIPEEDWKQTPESVKELVSVLISTLVEGMKQFEQRLSELEEENRLLKEQLANNSGNSSLPPSSDKPANRPKRENNSTGKRRGGQKGHPGSSRKLLPVEECQKVIDYRPKQCRRCGEKLGGDDPQPLRHQVVEIPPLKPYVEEHRLHSLECKECGAKTRAKLPAEVAVSGYGVRLVATVAMMSGLYRMSERLVQAAMADLFGVEMALGTVNALRQEASLALSSPVEEARKYVQKQSIVYSDETGFRQGNADGLNAEGEKAWLWVAVSNLVTVFLVQLSRGQDAASKLLGEKFLGLAVTDRWNGYNWLDLSQRQLCWAHLKRDFTKISERSGESGRIGKLLLEQEQLLFNYWHRVRDGTLKRSSFKIYASKIRQNIRALLEQGADYKAKKGEKTARAMTARTCRELLKLEPAMWLFLRVEALEPTNNLAERAIRPAVVWRKSSFGTQSEGGSQFLARIMTVVMTLRAQQRNIFDYLIQACKAVREGNSVPSLLPSASLFQSVIPLAV
jgi:transposase